MIRSLLRRRRERWGPTSRPGTSKPQLQQAADIAITAAVRAQRSEPVADLHVVLDDTQDADVAGVDGALSVLMGSIGGSLRGRLADEEDRRKYL
ncbi:hypothetical protein ABZZ74_53315 [Streptomyces sp. NPDC006476]|uniref:hypothetical protein n=1 Tax=Streptomyces sp. NPDC006476 TaxID=3157175 RepID=UPI0033B8F74B